ncbi:MAG: PD-(D/E)XK nuclease family protein [Candidatus Omnitrophica bacterium]|nr:PD-(D/E)XK nuclease family protein [Candidatus Omnitrophota bacterium]
MNTYWKRRPSWSKSRQGILEQCPFAYYYTYIGRYEKTEEGKTITQLLKLQKFYFFKGTLIHSAVRGQITQKISKRPISLEAAKNFIDLEFSKISNDQAKYISEAHNGFPLERSFLENERQDALSQITTFFSVLWPSYESLEILAHERLENFQIGDVKVWVQPDLVTKNLAGELIISDWKTGKEVSVSADTDLQLSVYILWASLHFAVNIEGIGAELTFLKTAQSFPTRRKKEQIDTLKDYIIQQARKMVSFRKKEDFIPKPNFNLCKGCNFATICPAAAMKEASSEGMAYGTR